MNDISDIKRSKIASNRKLSYWRYDELYDDSEVLWRYSKALSDVFNAKGNNEWNAGITVSHGRKKILYDLKRKNIDIILFTLENEQNRILGFSYGYCLDKDNLGMDEGPYYLENINKKVIVDHVKMTLTKRPEVESIFYFATFGIIKDARLIDNISFPMQLMIMVLREIASKNPGHILFYTIKQSPIYLLCKTMGAEKLLEVHGENDVEYFLFPMNKL